MVKYTPLLGLDAEQLPTSHHQQGNLDYDTPPSSFLSGPDDHVTIGAPSTKQLLKAQDASYDMWQQSLIRRDMHRRQKLGDFLPTSFEQCMTLHQRNLDAHKPGLKIVGVFQPPGEKNFKLENGQELPSESEQARYYCGHVGNEPDDCGTDNFPRAIFVKDDDREGQAVTMCKYVHDAQKGVEKLDPTCKGGMSWSGWKSCEKKEVHCVPDKKCDLPRTLDGLRWQAEKHGDPDIECEGKDCSGPHKASAYEFEKVEEGHEEANKEAHGSGHEETQKEAHKDGHKTDVHHEDTHGDEHHKDVHDAGHNGGHNNNSH